MPYSEYLSSIEEIIEDARNGRMFILVDDEDRENEGDLIIPAQMATPDAVNFMATHGRGLICLSLAQDRCEELNLHLMEAHNQSRLATAFTVSIEAKDGVTTGISASDRAHTISVAIDPNKGKSDLATPGHVFPLMARDGGVLVRAGHTEAAVDICRMAGLTASGVICEIMNDDGNMARMPDLIPFAQKHGLKIATIADLIAYRRRTEKYVEQTAERPFNSKFGNGWVLRVYKNLLSNTEHLALVRGDLSRDEPVMVRMHQVNVLSDMFWDADSPKTGELHRAMSMVADHGHGAVVVLREMGVPHFGERIKAEITGEEPPARLMDYGVGAQILVDLGIKNMILLSNTPRTIIGLDGYGLKVTEQRPIPLED
ncbi:MAG: 3,4-dihydroxy-2-butanone-4-phosphate synthase [Alphaproteobacteria bacterium]|nr:3,4-dihydroxy-2-butanone-4-phosphate synthase [Alphaproteobacteria bacterium]